MRPTHKSLIEALDPPLRLLLEVTEGAAREVGVRLWLVGGGTRDLAAGRPLHDLDLAMYSADGDTAPFLDAIARRIEAIGGATIERTDRFGTASVEVDDTQSGSARVDLARLRTEHYVTPGALPEIRSTDRIERDLTRRDFTVNAIALCLVGEQPDEIVDPYDGLADLAAKRLRVLHERSFVDDATRLWRGARTAALLDLEPDAATLRLITEGGRWLEPISGDRLWHELAATADRGRALRTLERLDAWGVLEATSPGLRLTSTARTALAGRRSMPVDRLAAVLLATLPEDVREAALTRLSAGRGTRVIVDGATRLLAAGAALADSTDGSSIATRTLDVVERLADTNAQARTAARWLAPESQAALQRALARWERTKPHLGAEELVTLGIARGPALGEALRGLRRARYLGTLSTAADARALVRAVVAGAATWPAG